jgi:hypothetical protein
MGGCLWDRYTVFFRTDKRLDMSEWLVGLIFFLSIAFDVVDSNGCKKRERERNVDGAATLKVA